MTADRPFADLPAALVDEILGRTEQLGEVLQQTFQEMKDNRHKRRRQLETAQFLLRESDLPYVQIPTTCGIDGAFAIERLLAVDLVAAAAVAVEGLTPPSEQRYWPEPQHQSIVETEAHDEDSGTVARALMMGMELSLAVNAPHEAVFLDGSLTTPIIFFNQALNTLAETPNLYVSKCLAESMEVFLSAYRTILRSQRSDKCWIAVPKYTTRREIGERMQWSTAHDDRAMLTSLLYPGEMTPPIALDPPKKPWHINIRPVQSTAIASLAQEIVHLLSAIRVLYYRPYPSMPALRVEVTRAVADTPSRLALAVQAVKHQCGTGALMEPYPLYMADRMAKSLASAIPTFRQIASQRMAEQYNGDIADVFLGLHGYRTESGR